MNLLFATLILLLFLLGLSRTIDLFRMLKEAETRRNLVIRVGGFFAMSMWLHSLPSILLSVFMRHEGILAPEVVAEDGNRSTIVGLYVVFYIVFLVGVASAGALAAFASKTTWKLASWTTLGGYAFMVSIALFEAFGPYGDWRNGAFLFAIVTTLSAYAHVTLLAPLDVQIKAYSLPFAVIGVITFVVFQQSQFTHQLVWHQLSRFRSGGATEVFVKYGVEAFRGTLILQTNTTAYIRAHSHKIEKRDFMNVLSDPLAHRASCVVRIPVADATIVYLPSLADTDAQLDGYSADASKSLVRIKIPDGMATLCGTAVEARKP